MSIVWQSKRLAFVWDYDITEDQFRSFLTGGTALAAYNLFHRESQDLDLFSIEPFDMNAIGSIVNDIAKTLGASVESKTSTDKYKFSFIFKKTNRSFDDILADAKQ